MRPSLGAKGFPMLVEMREAHGSYELEEMILAVAEDAPANGAPVPEEATK